MDPAPDVNEAALPRPVRATLAGLCASLVGIGLAHFAYNPLVPALIEDGALTPAQAGYVGAMHLGGYLVGALLAQRVAARVGAATALRQCMVLATVAFFGCAWPLSVAGFAFWRFLAGAAGAVLMVLAAPTALTQVPPGRVGLSTGAIFTGVGLGIAASGTVVPWLLPWGLAATWCGLGALSLVLTLLGWGGWPMDLRPAPATEPVHPATVPGGWPLCALYAEYGLNSIGLVPHIVFLADFIARGLGQGVDRAAQYWVVFGLGAIVIPSVAGPLADRFGFRRTSRWATALEAVAVVSPAAIPHPAVLATSSFIVGGLIPGMVPLTLGRLRDLMPDDPARYRTAWSIATVVFALGLAVSAFGYSFLFARTGRHTLLFGVGVGALALAWGLNRFTEPPSRDDPWAPPLNPISWMDR